MAITAKQTDLALKLQYESTDSEGDKITRTKTVTSLNEELTDAQLIGTAKAVDLLYKWDRTKTLKIPTYELTGTAE